MTTCRLVPIESLGCRVWSVKRMSANRLSHDLSSCQTVYIRLQHTTTVSLSLSLLELIKISLLINCRVYFLQRKRLCKREILERRKEGFEFQNPKRGSEMPGERCYRGRTSLWWCGTGRATKATLSTRLTPETHSLHRVTRSPLNSMGGYEWIFPLVHQYCTLTQ